MYKKDFPRCQALCYSYAPMALKIAIPNKGRLAEDTLDLLRSVGLRIPRGVRTLTASAGDGRYQILFARAQDIPEYVELGAADAGITGLDLVEETGRKVELLLNLDYGVCRLIVAAPERSSITAVEEIPSGARVATAFPNLTRRYFEKNRKKVSLVPVSGAAELTPTIGVADVIVDLTQTGSTLRQNHLTLLDVVMDSRAVLVAGPTARGAKRRTLEDLAHAFESVQNAARKRYLLANAPRKKVAEITRLIPGLKSPTVMDLAQKGLVAIHAVIDEGDIIEVVPRLKKAGATGILVLPIERMIP